MSVTIMISIEPSIILTRNFINSACNKVKINFILLKIFSFKFNFIQFKFGQVMINVFIVSIHISYE